MNGTNIRIFPKTTTLKSSVIPNFPESFRDAGSWHNVKQELQFKILLKAKQIPRRGAA